MSRALQRIATLVLFGYAAIGLWLRDRRLRALIPTRSSN